MSWLFSQVLVAAYLGENSLDGEQSVPLSGNPTQQAYCAPDKMTEFSRLSRFGMMFKPLTEDRGQELLMSYRADFRAKTSLPQEKAQESMENGQECGKKWQGSFAKYDPNTHSLRTVQCSLFEDLNQSLQTWPRWGSMRNGECFQRPMLVQTISEKEYGFSERIPNNQDFFHTPNTTGMDGGSNSRKALKKRMEQWPTPRAQEPARTSVGYGRGLKELIEGKTQIQRWPTPDANCGARGTQETWLPIRPSGQPAQYSINQAVRDLDSTIVGGKLNPMWVEWLMGWMLGWTDLKPLEMDKCHCVPQQLGTYLKED